MAEDGYSRYSKTHTAGFKKLVKDLDRFDSYNGHACFEIVLPRREGEGTTAAWLKGADDKTVLDCSEFDVARIANAFANEQRVRIMKALYGGARTFAELKEGTGMNPGQLQHHLKEMALSAYLLETPKRNDYALSSHGKAMLLLMLCVAKWEPKSEDEAALSPDDVEMYEVD